MISSINKHYILGENHLSTHLCSPTLYGRRKISEINWKENNTVINSIQTIAYSILTIVGSPFYLVGCAIRLLKGYIKPLKTSALLPAADPKMVGMVYKMCKDFDAVATKHGVKYFAQGGTAIGIERQKPGGFIKWDDDADLQLLPKEELKLATPIEGTRNFKVKDEVIQDLAAQNLKLVNHWGGWKLCPIQCPNDPFVKKYNETEYPDNPERHFTFPFVDVFISRVGDPRFPERILVDASANGSKIRNDHWLEEYITVEDVNKVNGNFERRPFGPITLPSPPNIKEYITRGYGKNWIDTAVRYYDHVTMKQIPREELKIIDFSPADYDVKYFTGDWL